MKKRASRKDMRDHLLEHGYDSAVERWPKQKACLMPMARYLGVLEAYLGGRQMGAWDSENNHLLYEYEDLSVVAQTDTEIQTVRKVRESIGAPLNSQVRAKGYRKAITEITDEEFMGISISNLLRAHGIPCSYAERTREERESRGIISLRAPRSKHIPSDIDVRSGAIMAMVAMYPNINRAQVGRVFGIGRERARQIIQTNLRDIAKKEEEEDAEGEDREQP